MDNRGQLVEASGEAVVVALEEERPVAAMTGPEVVELLDRRDAVADAAADLAAARASVVRLERLHRIASVELGRRAAHVLDSRGLAAALHTVRYDGVIYQHAQVVERPRAVPAYEAPADPAGEAPEAPQTAQDGPAPAGGDIAP